MSISPTHDPENSVTGFSARDSYVAMLIVATGAAHLALAGRYDIFRNELYFIVCGWRPAFGYVDQPPLAPWSLQRLRRSAKMCGCSDCLRRSLQPRLFR